MYAIYVEYLYFVLFLKIFKGIQVAGNMFKSGGITRTSEISGVAKIKSIIFIVFSRCHSLLRIVLGIFTHKFLVELEKLSLTVLTNL